MHVYILAGSGHHWEEAVIELRVLVLDDYCHCCPVMN